MRIDFRIERKAGEWFAWYPIKIGHETVWLEKVMRTPVTCYGWFMYYTYDLLKKD